MKKVLRILLIAVVAIVALVLVLGLFAPKDIVITRMTLIKAPKEAVFNQMLYFKNWTNWSPWYKMEPTVKMNYQGTDGTPGSYYEWVGKETGTGKMLNIAVAGTKMDFEVQFVKPFESKAEGILEATDSAGMTKATWTFHTKFGYPSNAMQLFMNMDKMIGKDFENGLANMKAYVESNPSPAAATQVAPAVDSMKK